MNETDEYILDAIRTYVWSGFYTPEEVDEMIDDILEPDADEAMLRAAVAPEFRKKAEAEQTWPTTTDCDRLDRAFEMLNAAGIVALHNAGYTMSDGIEDAFASVDERGRKHVRGYCFYHGQDVERAVNGEDLMLAFGDLDADPQQKTEVGRLVQSTLQQCGLNAQWNGDPETRISVSPFDGKRRTRR